MLPSIEPEYSVVKSEKTHLTENQLRSLSQTLCDLAVDTRVLYKELTRLEGICGRIGDDIHMVVVRLQELS